MGDGLIDLVEDAIGTVERIARLANRRASSRAQPVPPFRATRRPAPERTVARPEFSIIDALDAETGRPVFIVRNQQGDSAACSSIAFAQRVRDSLG